MNTVKHGGIQVLSPRRSRERKRQKKRFEEIMAENCPHLMKHIEPRIKEAGGKKEKTLSRKNTKRILPRHINCNN